MIYLAESSPLPRTTQSQSLSIRTLCKPKEKDREDEAGKHENPAGNSLIFVWEIQSIRWINIGIGIWIKPEEEEERKSVL
tara:strand:+ start:517 stop:756 length:240 start_codon:yes stop_codon:yes gene_type:complete